jgi:hypothetical protein
LVRSVRFVTQALVSSGTGWMDAEPEIDQRKTDICAVNEDGNHRENTSFAGLMGWNTWF